MRILGIDPGVAIVGFGLIETERSAVRMLQYGAINTSAGLPLATRAGTDRTGSDPADPAVPAG